MRKMKNPEPQLHYYDIVPNVTAFSSTRHGGVSEGNYASFNVNPYSGDDPEHIAQNRKALCKLLHIKPDRLIMPHQVHGTGVTQISKTFFLLSEDIRRTALEGIDALITNVPVVGAERWPISLRRQSQRWRDLIIPNPKVCLPS